MLKYFFFFVLSSFSLFSYDGFEYNLKISDREVVVKEAITLTLKLKQIDSSDVIQFDFKISDDDDYEVKLLESEDSKDAKGLTVVTSKYLLFPLKSGKLFVKPTLIVKRASKEELRKFVTGSADELMYLKTRNKIVKLKAIELSVDKIVSDIQIVGEYKLSYVITEKKISSDEQVNISYTLSGDGYKIDLDTILGNIPKVDIFLNKEQFDSKLFHKYTYQYALKSNDNFTIPNITIKAYNPKTKNIYKLEAPQFKINVEKQNIKSSIYIKESISGNVWMRYSNYLLLFIAGFIVHNLLKVIPQKSLTYEENFINNIKKSKNPKDLLKLLLIKDSQKFKQEIEILEQMIYHDREYKLSLVKSSIFERVFAIDKDSI